MTLQKAMRVRSELKKLASSLSDLLEKTPYEIAFEKNKPSEEELVAKREEKLARLDGESYEDVVKKLFKISDAIYELNVAIEKANRTGHELLYKESCLKAKLNYVNYLMKSERNIRAETYSYEPDYENPDANGNYKRVKVPVYTYSILKDDALGASLPGLQKSLLKELEEVRDDLAAFNAKSSIDYVVPEGLL